MQWVYGMVVVCEEGDGVDMAASTGHRARALDGVATNMRVLPGSEGEIETQEQTGRKEHAGPTVASRQQRDLLVLLVVVWLSRIPDPRTKRLDKERLGRRCAYAWERGADAEASNGRQGG